MENNDEHLGLTDEEIAALKEAEAEEGPDEKPAEDTDKDKKPDADAGDKGAGDDDGKATAGDASPQEQEPFVPKFAVVDQAELDSLKTALNEAKQKFEDGEIDYTQLDEAKDAYNEVKWKADFATESNKNMVDGRWKSEQERFLDDNKDYRDNKTLHAAFVATVNAIIVTDESKKMSDREVLVKAKEQVDADLQGLETDSSAAPSSVGEGNTTHHAGEFAHLDKLEGSSYQEAIDNLSPDQLARYEDL